MKTGKTYFKLHLLKTVLVLISIVFFFSSCRKIEEGIPDTIVNVQIVDGYSGRPIKNANVIVNEWDSRTENPSVFVILVKTTDERGLVNFRFKPSSKNYMKYNVDVYGSSMCGGSTPQAIQKGKANNMFFKMGFNTWINYHLKNINPFDSNDQICFYDYNNFQFWNTPACYTGMSVDTYVFLQTENKTMGGNKIPIKYTITKNNVTTTNIDSIDLPPCDTLIFDILY